MIKKEYIAAPSIMMVKASPCTAIAAGSILVDGAPTITDDEEEGDASEARARKNYSFWDDEYDEEEEYY
jgi:hypothetical protein